MTIHEERVHPPIPNPPRSIRAKVRAWVRTIAFLLSTILIYGVWVAVRPLVSYHRLVWLKWRNYIFQTWARMVVRIINAKLTIEGQPPKSPFVLVSNHLSYIDIVMLSTQVDAIFVAKHDIANWPLLGHMGAQMGAVFINRDNPREIPKAIQEIESYLGEQQGIIIFAEGTSSAGADVLPFNAPLMAPAARKALPVTYATIHYRTPPEEVPAHLSVCWWGGMSFRAHLKNLFYLPYFEARVKFGSDTIQESNRKLLTQKLYTAICDQFEPVVDKDEIG